MCASWQKALLLRKCARRLKMRKSHPSSNHDWWDFGGKMARLSVFVQQLIKNMLWRLVSGLTGLLGGKSSSETSSTHQGQTTVTARLTLLTTSGAGPRNRSFQDRNTSTMSRLLLSITTWQRFSQGTSPNHFSYTSRDEDYVRTKCPAGWPTPTAQPWRL